MKPVLTLPVTLLRVLCQQFRKGKLTTQLLIHQKKKDATSP